MEELISSINASLSQQPWWVIALGTAFLMLVFRCRSAPAPHCSHTSHMVGINKTGATTVISSGATCTVSEFKFDGETAEELDRLIQKGDKIAAIKLVRQKTGLDLVGAKTMVENLRFKK